MSVVVGDMIAAVVAVRVEGGMASVCLIDWLIA